MARTTPLTPPAFDEPLIPIGSSVTEAYTTTATPSTSLVKPVLDFLFEHIWPLVLEVSVILSLVLIVAILYAVFRVKQLRDWEDAFYKHQPMTADAKRTFGIVDSVGDTELGDVRWAEVIRHMEAGDQNSLRRAIMEADIMLDDALTAHGYTGESVGEKMKQVSRADINSIDDAWEAHKIRNKIAHEGSSYELSDRDARRAINLYATFFKEIGYISS